MTKRSQLNDHFTALDDIGTIMTAMKTLCSIELNKITKFLPMQEQVMQTIRDAGHDFFSAYPISPMNTPNGNSSLYILIGSERGFCGGFNDSVLHWIAEKEQQDPEFLPVFFVVGRKLALKMANDSRVIKTLDGANALEEIPAVILHLLQSLEEVASQQRMEWHSWQWEILFNEEEKNQIEVKTVRPFQEFFLTNDTPCSVPPVLNLSHEQFLSEFAEQYLFSMCYSIFYKSFYGENHQRLFHLNHALDSLENKRSALKKYLNILRQEEITEEIQNIIRCAEAIIGNDMKEHHLDIE